MRKTDNVCASLRSNGAGERSMYCMWYFLGNFLFLRRGGSGGERGGGDVWDAVAKEG